MSRYRAPVVTEKVEQAHILQLLTAIGGKFYTVGTRRAAGRNCPRCGTFVPEGQSTRQTPGHPDLVGFLPKTHEWHVRLAYVEVKSRVGRQSTDQADFQAHCEAAGVPYILGTLDDVIAWLIKYGYAHANQFPHYRQPKGST